MSHSASETACVNSLAEDKPHFICMSNCAFKIASNNIIFFLTWKMSQHSVSVTGT